MRTGAVVLGAVLGGLSGYYLGVLVACYWLYPGSNLCGLVGAFGTGPIGLVAGGAGGWWASRRPGRG